jgi:hypothetical protein
VLVQDQSAANIASLIANLESRPINLSRTTRIFRRRSAPCPSSAVSLSSFRGWMLSSQQQLIMDSLSRSLAANINDCVLCPELKEIGLIPVEELCRLVDTTSIANIIMDACTSYWCLSSPVPVTSTFSDLFHRLRSDTSYTLSHPHQSVRYYGLPDRRLQRHHDLIMVMQLPNHWAVAIVQPYASEILYYDGARGVYPGCSYEDVVPLLRAWLEAAYSGVDLFPSLTVDKWSVSYPRDAPHQTHGLNCGPNMLMYIYTWIMHRRSSTTSDWDPYNPNPFIANSQVKAMRDFLGYHLLTHGGLHTTLRLSSSPTPNDPGITAPPPSQPYIRPR